MAREEAEDIRSSQQRARHTEKKMYAGAFGKGSEKGGVVEVVEMLDVDDGLGRLSE
jgi:hypothetical protein